MRSSGDTAVTTGHYRSDCACGSQITVERGTEFPTCPKCGAAVAWVYQRSSYIPPKEPPAKKSGT